jgi:4'-phosphopantetheinyl transferase
MLKCYLGQEGADAQIVPDGRGKPSLLRQDGSKCGVEINISHSRTHVAVAMSYCGPVGIDTESRWLSEAQLRRMSARILTPDAAKRFAALNADAQPNELLRQWCAREALLKAWGVGLTGGLRSVHLPVPLPASPLTVDGHVVQVISRAPVVCLAHPVLDGRRVRYCAGRPFNKSES